MSDSTVQRLGALLLSTGDITAEVLAAALAEQARTKEKLGEVLVGRGVRRAVVTLALLRQARGHMAKGRLGEIMVDLGYATPTQIGQALFFQVVDKKPLGQVLVEMWAVTPAQLSHALQEQTTRARSIEHARLAP